MSLYIVQYDISGMAEDPENPGHAISYIEGNSAVPTVMRNEYRTVEEAQAEADRLSEMEVGTGETIDITLANGKKYVGPRYIYRVCSGR